MSVSRPIRIEPSAGQLIGSATIAFPIPDRLPPGVTSQDLMVTAYSPELNARLPQPFTLDETSHRAVVMTDHFSDWELDAQDPATVRAAQQFGEAAGTDAARNNGDPFAGFLNRLYPIPQEPQCGGSTQLDVQVTDFGLPNGHPVCAENTGKPGEVRLKLVNNHFYPALVDLPHGVRVETGIPEAETFEEVMSQLMAEVTDGGKFFLRGGSTATLLVDVNELEPGTVINEHVDLSLLLSDMALWTADMGVNQKGAGWKYLEKYKDDHDKLQQFADCFKTAADDYRAATKPEELKGKDGTAKAAKFAKDTLDRCAKPAAKAVQSFWNKAFRPVKELEQTAETAVSPLATKITQLKNLWDNPGIVSEIVEGEIAALTPGDADVVKIALNKPPPNTDNATQSGIQGQTYAFLTDVDPSRQVVTFDAIQWFSGPQALEACKEDHVEPDNEWCNSYYYRNTNTLLRIMAVRPGAPITMFSRTGSPVDVPVTLNDVAESNKKIRYTYRLMVVDNEIAEMHEVFTP